MKIIPITLFGIATLSAVSLQAQWTVYDPAVHSQMIVSSAEEIAKFVEVINNQVNQVRQMTEQVNTLHHYVDLFGDPAKVALLSESSLRLDLLKPETGKTLTDLVAAADPVAMFEYVGEGLFQAIGHEFTTPGGATIERSTKTYRPIAAAQNTTQNFLAVSKDAAVRRVSIKEEIAKTIEALKEAQTDAEVQKLSGVLVGLSGALAGLEQEVAQATSSALVQDLANRADAERQVAAKKEQQHAEFSEAVGNYGKVFRLWSAPVAFPTKY
jgi:hypothetical protein